MGEGEFSTAYHMLDLREERRDIQQIWDDAKLKGLVDDLEANDRRLILLTKNTGSWLIVRGTTVTGTLLAATDFCDFFVHVMMLTPLNFRKNATAMLHPSTYVTDLAAATEA